MSCYTLSYKNKVLSDYNYHLAYTRFCCREVSGMVGSWTFSFYPRVSKKRRSSVFWLLSMDVNKVQCWIMDKYLVHNPSIRFIRCKRFMCLDQITHDVSMLIFGTCVLWLFLSPQPLYIYIQIYICTHNMYLSYMLLQA